MAGAWSRIGMSSGVTGLKQDADREAARQQQQRAGAAFNPDTCKFQYHALGDDLGNLWPPPRKKNAYQLGAIRTSLYEVAKPLPDGIC